MTDHLNVPVQLLAYARIKKLDAELAAAAIHPDCAARQLAIVQELILHANVARSLGEPEYRDYLRACVTTSEDGVITLY